MHPPSDSGDYDFKAAEPDCTYMPNTKQGVHKKTFELQHI